MKKMTKEQLGISSVPFESEGFTPKYMAKDFCGTWFCYEQKPSLENGEWITRGSPYYEIGVDDEEESNTPPNLRWVQPEESLFEIKD